MTEKLRRGTQIIYVPTHADGDEKHKDCEPGFVITDKGESAFCRYFSNNALLIDSLRTVANSELTPKTNLVVKDTYIQEIIDKWVKKIELSPEIYGYIERQQYHIWSFEHNAWWRPNERGYTINIHNAGLYNKAEAEEICKGANITGKINEEMRLVE